MRGHEQAPCVLVMKNAIRGMSRCCTGLQVCRKRFGGSTGIARPVRFRGMSITAFQRYAKRSTLCALHHPYSSGRPTSSEIIQMCLGDEWVRNTLTLNFGEHSHRSLFWSPPLLEATGHESRCLRISTTVELLLGGETRRCRISVPHGLNRDDILRA